MWKSTQIMRHKKTSKYMTNYAIPGFMQYVRMYNRK